MNDTSMPVDNVSIQDEQDDKKKLVRKPEEVSKINTIPEQDSPVSTTSIERPAQDIKLINSMPEYDSPFTNQDPKIKTSKKDKLPTIGSGKVVKRIPLTPEQIKDKQRAKKAEYENDLFVLREKKKRGEPLNKKEIQLEKDILIGRRTAFTEGKSKARQDLISKGYQPEVVAKLVPDSITEGLVGAEGQNVRLNSQFDARAVQATEVEEIGNQQIVKGFAGMSNIPMDSIPSNLTGQELRKYMAGRHLQYIAPSISLSETDFNTSLNVAEKIFGNSLFVVKKVDDAGKPIGETPVEVIEDIIHTGGNYVFDESTGRDFIQYEDKEARLLDIALSVQAAGGDETKAIEIYKKFSEIVIKDKEELNKEIDSYREGLAKNDIGTWDAFLAGVKAFLNPKQFYGDNDEPSINLAEKLLGSGAIERFTYTGDVAVGRDRYSSDITDAQKKAIEAMSAKATSQKSQGLASLYQALGRVDNIDYLVGVSPLIYYLDKIGKENNVDLGIKKYIPTTTTATRTALSFAQGFAPAGSGILLNIADAEAELRDQAPNVYYPMLFTMAATMGASRLIPQAGTALLKGGIKFSPKVVPSTQAGLQIAQTGANYFINKEGYTDKKGNTDWQNVIRDLVIDVPASGFDFKGIIKAKHPDIVPVNMYNIVFRNADTGEFMAFTQDPKTKLMRNFTVSEQDVQKWMETQTQANRQFIFDTIGNDAYAILAKNTSSPTVMERIKKIAFGTEIPVTDEQKATSKALSPTVRSKESIVDGQVVRTEKTYNPLAVVNEDGTVEKVQSNAVVGRRLQDLPDENRQFSTLSLLDETDAPLNIKSNLVGDNRVLPTMRDLESNGYVIIEPNGNLRLTDKGSKYSKQLGRVNEKFQKLIETQQDEYGSNPSPKKRAEINEQLKDNPDWTPEKTEQIVNIQDIQKMNLKQRASLAIRIAIGDMDYNPNTGIAQNTSFTRKYNDRTYDFGRNGMEDSKLLDLAKTINAGKPKVADREAITILKNRGLEETPENIQRIKDEALDKLEQLRDMPDIGGVVKVKGLKNNFGDEEEVVKDVDNADTLTPTDSESDVKPTGSDRITIEHDNGNSHTYRYDEELNVWVDTKGTTAIPDRTLKAKVNSGESKVIGKVPESWTKARQKAKDTYKSQNSQVKQSLVPKEVSREEARQFYKDEANVLNLAVFGHTAEQWREANPQLGNSREFNVRDSRSDQENLVLANMTKLNEQLIAKGMSQDERIIRLNREARKQFKAMEEGKYKPVPSNRVDKPVKNKESKAIAKILKGADEDLVTRVQNAVRNGKTNQVSKLIRQIAGEDASLSTINALYNKIQNAVLSSDLEMAETSFVNRTLGNLTLERPSTIDANQHSVNRNNWVERKGEIVAHDGHIINLDSDNPNGSKWSKGIHIEQSTNDKTTFYVSNDAMTSLRVILGKKLENGDNTTAGFVATKVNWLKEVVSLYAKSDPSFKVFSDQLNATKGFVSFIKVAPDRNSYNTFSNVQIHEGTHKIVLNKIGGTLIPDTAKLNNIFNNKDGQLITLSLNENYSKYGRNEIAHEILAFATNPDDFNAFFREDAITPELINAFINTYDRILRDMRLAHGDEAEKIVTRYTNDEIKKAVIEIRNNERRITQDSIQSTQDRYREAENIITRGVSGDASEKTIWRGSGIKRLKARRYTTTGNPLDLTGVAGAETQRLRQAGALPPINMFVETPDGRFALEKPFKAEIFKPFEIEGEFNLADINTDPVVQKLFEDHKFNYPKFQEELEKLGYDGVYNSYEDVSDEFRYKVQLFRNDKNIARLTEMQSLDMYQNAGKRIFENLMKMPSVRDWMEGGAVQKVLFHGTRVNVDFNKFDPPTIFREFGTHVGTVRQAHDFVYNIKVVKNSYKEFIKAGLTREQAVLKLSESVFRKDNLYASDRVIPVITNIKNPYRVLDTQWYPSSLIREIQDSDITLDNLINAYLKNPEAKNNDEFINNRAIDYVTKEVQRNKYNGIDNAKEYLFGIIDENNSTSYTRQFVIDLLGEMGYDSLVYANIAEGVRQKTEIDTFHKTRKLYKTTGYDEFNFPIEEVKSVVDTYRINQYDDSYIIFDNSQIKMALSPEFDTFHNSIAELAALDMAEVPMQRKDIQEIYKKNPNKVSVDEMQKVLEEGTWSKIKIPTDRVKDLEKDLQKYKLKYKANYDNTELVVMYDNPDSRKLINIFRDKYNLDNVVHSDAGRVIQDNSDGTYKKTYGVKITRNEDVDGDMPDSIISMSDGNIQFDVDFSKSKSEESVDVEIMPTLDMYSKSQIEKITNLDKKLADGDYESWLQIAETSVPEGLLSINEIRAIKKLSDAKDISGLQNYIVNLNKDTFISLMLDVATVGLLGLRTIGKNLTGNTLKQVLDEVVRIPHSVLQMGVDFGAKKAGKEVNEEDKIRSIVTNPVITLKAIGEGIFDGITKGIPAGIKVMTGKEATNFEHPSLGREKTVGWNIGDWNMLRIPEDFRKYAWRLQGAIDRPFAMYAYKRAMSEIISVKKQEAEKAGYKLTTSEVIAMLPDSDYEIARNLMLEATFQNDNAIATAFSNKLDKYSTSTQAILRFPIKFIKTPLNVVDYTLGFTGLYPVMKKHYQNRKEDPKTNYLDFIKTSKEIINNPKDRKVISEAISKGLIGAAMTWFGYAMAREGILTPMYDEKDKNEQEQMEAKGTSFGSMIVNGVSFDITWLNPFSFYMLAGASVYQDGVKHDEKINKLQENLTSLESIEPEFQEIDKIEIARAELEKAKANSPFMAVTNRVLSNLASQTPFLRQIQDVSKKGAVKYLTDTYGAVDLLVPQFIGDVAKTMDTTKRVIRNDSWVNNKLDKMQNKIPYLSSQLPAESDMLGDDIQTGYGFDPFKTNKINADGLSSELDRLNISITTKPTGNKLLDNRIIREKGKFIKPYLEGTLVSEEYANVDDSRKASMLRDIIFNTNKMRTEKEPKEKIDHKVDILKDMHYTAQLLKSNDKSLNVEKITDKNTIRDIIRAGIDVSKLDTKSILNAIGETDKEINIFLRNMYSYQFFNKDNTLLKSKEKFEEYKKDRGAKILTQYVNRLDRAESDKRIAKWKAEIRATGETDEAKINAIIDSKSKKYGKSKSKQYQSTKEIIIPKSANLADAIDDRNYKNSLPIDGMPIEYPDSPDKWKGQRPSQNIIDAREGSTYLNIENTIFEGTGEEIQKLSTTKEFLKLSNAERERLIENIDNVLKSDADTIEDKTKTALTSLRKRIILD